ncbi:Surfactin synthase thioesterase subunit [Chitinophaga sp. YR573]|uniref:thioesterase II family protein n=1 Tax=Chitinophaga sp. YR573 TaxID=1881040 RepID=UPI0008ABFE03|nr:thioesterase domain-containing protein [Chitinophaga sp. YR573]SEW42774.1 Surfactin synthase thioesterase subunit [Chitinophaga sp. YR573]
MRTINLFCLPFAGGNKYSYREYEKYAPPFLNIIPLEYPGRGGRMGEAFIYDMHQLAEDLYEKIRYRTDGNDYAIYGHSMGALVAYLLAKKMIVFNHRLPLHLFLTGTVGPSAISRSLKKRHLLPKNEFIEELRVLDGSPQEVLENEELLAFFEPVLRADFKASETYQHKASMKLNIPMTVITGDKEDMTEEDILLWANESSETEFIKMTGSHFFIFSHIPEIMGIIKNKLIRQG